VTSAFGGQRSIQLSYGCMVAMGHAFLRAAGRLARGVRSRQPIVPGPPPAGTAQAGFNHSASMPP
jgi:hypothetical protein